jgi:hypothetical protein
LKGLNIPFDFRFKTRNKKTEDEDWGKSDNSVGNNLKLSSIFLNRSSLVELKKNALAVLIMGWCKTELQSIKEKLPRDKLAI